MEIYSQIKSQTIFNTLVLCLVLSNFISRNNLNAQSNGSCTTIITPENSVFQGMIMPVNNDAILEIDVHYFMFVYDDGSGGISEIEFEQITERVNQSFAASESNIQFAYCQHTFIENTEVVEAGVLIGLESLGGMTYEDYYVHEDIEGLQSEHALNIFIRVNYNIIPNNGGVASGIGAKSLISSVSIHPIEGVLPAGVSTLVHEIGHSLGLVHTHIYQAGTTNELIDGSNCELAVDQICDTPPDPGLTRIMGFPNTATHTIPADGCTYLLGDNYSNISTVLGQTVNSPESPVDIEALDAFQQAYYETWQESFEPSSLLPYNPDITNFMSYYSDDCKSQFSAGQIERMRTIIMNHNLLQGRWRVMVVSETTEGLTGNYFLDQDHTLTVSEGETFLTSATIELKSIVIESGGALTIDQNSAIWISDGIQVQDGASLTILDSEVWLSNMIDLQCGASFNCIGSKLDASKMPCTLNTGWPGIRTWGQSSYCEHAYVNIVDSEIRNAHTAIHGGYYPEIAEELSGWSCGPIHCENTSFKNNVMNLNLKNSFPSFILGGQFGDDILFQGCQFLGSNSLAATSDLNQYSIYLENIGEASFVGCTLARSAMHQIYAVNSYVRIPGSSETFFFPETGGFTLYDGTIGQNTSYVGQYGVFATNLPGQLIPLTIEGATFSGYLNRAIYHEGGYMSSIINSSITVSAPIDVPTYGLYMNGCSAFDITENEYFGVAPSGENDEQYGLVIKDAGNASNTIQRNYFDGLDIVGLPAISPQVGILALNDNTALDLDNPGLTMECNEFFQNQFSILVGEEPLYDDELPAGIASEIGQPSRSAGNNFEGSSIDFANDQTTINYYSSGDNGFNPNESSYGFTLVPNADPNTCEADIAGLTLEDLENTLQALEANLDASKGEYFTLLDGGNSTQLTLEIFTTDFTEAVELTISLLEKSPYLSEEALLAAIHREFDLPNALLAIILQANPHAAKSSTINERLSEKAIPLNELEREMLEQGLQLVSVKEKLEATIHAQTRNRNFLMDEMIRREGQGTVDTQKVIDLMLRKGDTRSKYDVAAILYSIGKSIEAKELLNDIIPHSRNISSHNNVLEFFKVFERYIQGNELTAQEIESLRSISAEKAGPAPSWSRSLLRLNEIVDYTEPLIANFENRSLQQQSESNSPAQVNVYPNPAAETVIVSTSLGSITNISAIDISGRVHVFDTLGTINTVAIDVSKLAASTYILQIDISNGSSQFVPLIVTH